MTDTTHSTNDDAKLLALWDEWKVALAHELAATTDRESQRHKRVMRLHEAIASHRPVASTVFP
jgi:hypothetical protein